MVKEAMKKYRDENGNLYYTCLNCKEEFNFKAMEYITESDTCPVCDERINLSSWCEP